MSTQTSFQCVLFFLPLLVGRLFLFVCFFRFATPPPFILLFLILKKNRAFWNDEFQATSSSYAADVCSYSAYSDESLPYTFCSSDNDCGQRCSSSPYAPCDDLGDDDPICGGSTCKQISCTAKVCVIDVFVGCLPKLFLVSFSSSSLFLLPDFLVK